MKKTYLSKKVHLKEFAQEAISLYRLNFIDIERKTKMLGDNIRAMIRSIESDLGRPLQNCDILEVGPGQGKPLMYALGSKNNWTGIDIEVAPETYSVKNIYRIYNKNGFQRALKTLVRQSLGIDRRRARALEREFGVPEPSGKVLEADAAQMPFDDDSFDLVVSVSVFEHLTDPHLVMREIARVLRSGGVAHIITHLYTSATGAHDPRLFNNLKALPYWSHLRNEHLDKVETNSYLNKWRASKFITAFQDAWVGSESKFLSENRDLKVPLQQLKQKGELGEYHDQELLHDVLITTWRKP